MLRHTKPQCRLQHLVWPSPNVHGTETAHQECGWKRGSEAVSRWMAEDVKNSKEKRAKQAIDERWPSHGRPVDLIGGAVGEALMPAAAVVEVEVGGELATRLSQVLIGFQVDLSCFTLLQSRSMKTLSSQRPRPSMLI